MSRKIPKILIIVEGAKTDLRLMEKVLALYGISDRHQIISYNTGIYDLYEKMFFEDDPGSLDLLQVLKEHEKDESKKRLFEEHYSDIILIFDLDPQSPNYTPEAIKKMAAFFSESSNAGKLYLNYPMVESFYHMKSIPDPEFNTYIVTTDNLLNKSYKTHVKQACRIPYRRFAATKEECDTVIRQNLDKAAFITGYNSDDPMTDTSTILNAQLASLHQDHQLFVLCTCIFYIVDYNPHFIQPPLYLPSQE